MAVAVDGGGGGGGGSGGGDGSSACEGVQEVPWRGKKSAAMTEIPSRERSGWCSSVLRRRLKALHERYGEFAEENGYVRCEDKEVIDLVFFVLFAPPPRPHPARLHAPSLKLPRLASAWLGWCVCCFDCFFTTWHAYD